MNILCRILLSCTLTLAATQVSPASLDEPAAQTTKRLWVPFDHGKPEEGSFLLQYEVGMLFNQDLPTVFVIADGQQDHPRGVGLAALQEDLFGGGMNVVSIASRGQSVELQGRTQTPAGDTDWAKAYHDLQATQWVGDIEMVRRDLLGSRRVHLYGQSGGSFLIHQLLRRYGEHVERVFIDASATPSLRPEAALNSLHNTPGGAVPQGPQKLPTTVAAQVRRFELYLLTAFPRVQARAATASDSRASISPEGTWVQNHPLFKLHEEGTIPTPTIEFTPSEDFDTEVLILASPQGSKIEHLRQASLAARYPRGHLLLLEGDHRLKPSSAAEFYPSLVQDFLHFGYQSKAFQKVLVKFESLKRRK